uniref:Uncharacterized protein n=1 Tax=Propithecus coquereli TaxID=379532 RepID=A0A2K6GL30_PROCO
VSPLGAAADSETGHWRCCLLESMSQKSCAAEPRAPGSPSLLKEEGPEPLSQQVQATSSLHLSHRAPVALEYLPFFRTRGRLAEEELSLQREVCRAKAPLPEDSALSSGFFPYYCSEEESFPSLVLPAWSCGGPQDSPTRREAQADCFCRTTVGDGCS